MTSIDFANGEFSIEVRAGATVGLPDYSSKRHDIGLTFSGALAPNATPAQAQQDVALIEGQLAALIKSLVAAELGIGSYVDVQTGRTELVFDGKPAAPAPAPQPQAQAAPQAATPGAQLVDGKMVTLERVTKTKDSQPDFRLKPVDGGKSDGLWLTTQAGAPNKRTQAILAQFGVSA